MAKSPDEFDAVRTVVETLSSFEQRQQEQILRWAQERLGVAVGSAVHSGSQPHASLAAHHTPAATTPHPTGAAKPTTDIKTFVEGKKPKNDVQFVTTVAYYYRFEAPADQRKDEIGKDDLVNACRLVSRKRPPNPDATVRNAHNLGYLEKGNTKGKFAINSVGENLVAMVLPDGSSAGASSGRRRNRRNKAGGSRRKKPVTQHLTTKKPRRKSGKNGSKAGG
jgi:hypothetical protein